MYAKEAVSKIRAPVSDTTQFIHDNCIQKKLHPGTPMVFDAVFLCLSEKVSSHKSVRHRDNLGTSGNVFGCRPENSSRATLLVKRPTSDESAIPSNPEQPFHHLRTSGLSNNFYTLDCTALRLVLLYRENENSKEVKRHGKMPNV